MEPINILFILGLIFQASGINFWNVQQSGYSPAAMNVTHASAQSHEAHR